MTKLSMMRRLCAKLWHNESGIAAVEFALMVPAILFLLVGGLDVMSLMLQHQKAERVAYSVADLVAQTENFGNVDLQQVALAPQEIMRPFNFNPIGRVIITMVNRGPNDAAGVVRWRCTVAGQLARNSRLGEVNTVPVLPGNLTINPRDTIIIAEVFYNFNPILPIDEISSDEIYKVALFKTRFGSMTNRPC